MPFFAARGTGTKTSSFFLTTALISGLIAVPGQGISADLEWNAGGVVDTLPAVGGVGDWDQGLSLNWLNAALSVGFGVGDNALFGAPGGYTVTAVDTISVGDITFSETGIAIVGSDLTVAGTISVTTAGDSASIGNDITANANVGGAGDLNLTGEVAGSVVMDGSGTLSVSNTINALDHNTGTTNLGGGSVVTTTTTVDDGTVVVDGGTLTGDTTISGTGTLDVDTGIVGNVIANSGTLDADGGTIGSLDLDGGAGHTIADTAMVTGATTIDNATLTQTGGALTTVTLGA
ncbi:hypothetical protein OS190_18620, partial [Sulfitobacter sp. F26204]|uniref:hypothetical protein n=1 Tax=Sulfitobacter sp. F26204 TaxID=2996014 RepID=UPI00225DD849